MVDLTTFRHVKPNYSRPRIEPVDTDSDGFDLAYQLFGEPSSNSDLDQVKHNGLDPRRMRENDLMICCPTMRGFSLDRKIWGEW